MANNLDNNDQNNCNKADVRVAKEKAWQAVLDAAPANKGVNTMLPPPIVGDNDLIIPATLVNVVQLRPTYLEPIFDNIPAELKVLKNWVCWRAEPPKDGKAKWAKVPYASLQFNLNADGQIQSAKRADTTDPATWGTFDEAHQAYRDSRRWKRPFDGIGFVFDGAVGEDGLCYCGVDFDAWGRTRASVMRHAGNLYRNIPQPERCACHCESQTVQARSL
jgi:hypothetical protein